MSSVRWQPFFLNPPGIFPQEGVDLNQYLEGRYGPGIARARKHLDTIGGSLGIKFVHEGKRVGDTIDSHRIIEYARDHSTPDKNLEDAIVKVLFRRYFEENQYLGDMEILADAAAEVGLDRDLALEYLVSGKGREEVATRVQSFARTYGIRGVPFFIVRKQGSEKKVTFSGAQDEETWLEAVQEALAPQK